MSVGIENIKIVTVSVGTLSTAIAALIDKGPGLDDLPAVQSAAFALFALKDCQFGEIKAEIMDVDALEQGVLAKLFADNFNIVADTTEEIIEKGVAFIMMSVPFLISIISQIKPKPAV
jgi:hypothetical protein